jgi:endogenous inhibitor of DNA gyrase (YacG/DUF329 family)
MNPISATFDFLTERQWKPLGKRCPVCSDKVMYRKASGMTDDGMMWDGIESICPTCGKATLDDPFAIENNNPMKSVAINGKGWVKCPCCARLFRPSDAGAFRKGRHYICGQALIVKDAESSL